MAIRTAERSNQMVKRCLVLGSANSLQADLDRALKMAEFHGVIAAKDAGIYWKGELDAWVTLHPERMLAARKIREARGYPPAKLHFGHAHKEGDTGIDIFYDYKFDGQRKSASSGIFAVKVALEFFKFDKVVLCGVPLQRDQGRIDGKVNWNGGSTFHRGFEEAMPAFKDRVRSMGGWTALRVGLPTPTWLEV